ncbi:putative bifunctional diguanylate cyclase/phosphodiesterase [Candidatus Epulonipiscium viviparus]|uniref:putative bifunctional diguanylate cyclase/phosphodiesterase n=1 Tax=Candidatus Epulonipiscium viviparus TaxID=420336 RepID=UPI00016BFB33|nr:bifunctional diguanylate cyclase/phosphodiesterase [Candidatus Epulopiscium viviparus]
MPEQYNNGTLEEVMILKIDYNGTIVAANEYAQKRLGLNDKEDRFRDIILYKNVESVDTVWKKIRDTNNKSSIDMTFKSRDEELIYTVCTVEKNTNKQEIELSAIDIKKYDLIQKNNRYTKKLHSNVSDLEKALNKKYRELSTAIEIENFYIEDDTPTVLYKLNIKTGAIEKSQASTKIRELLNQNAFFLENHKNIDIYSYSKICSYHEEALKTNKFEYSMEIRYNHSVRGNIWIYLMVKYFRPANSDLMNILVTMVDINEEKNSEEQSMSLLYDPVTGSPNKNFFIRYFNEHKDTKLAFIYLDADNFKSINDSFGRAFGDAVLNEIIKRVNGIKHDKFIIGRCFADEFLIVIEDFEDENEINDFMMVLSQIFDEPFTNSGVSFGVSYSAGISVYPKDGKNFEDILNNADIAMHRVKAEGKRNFVFYNPSFKQTVLEKMYMESDLREGIKNNEFSLYYQPQVDMLTNKVRGFEALIRWLKPDGRIIPPFKFITSAEETGLMIPMGAWIIEEACKFINKLRDAGYENVHVAVNISAVQITQKSFVPELREIVERTKVNTKQLHIEITETILMKDIKTNTAKIRKLQDMGIIIALDDFGTGYSSLTYLKQLPIDVLKIEKSFVDDIGTGRKNLVGPIINLGHELDLEVVAEGVEEREQLDYLLSYNCDILQGYIVSKPMPEDEVMAFLESEYAPEKTKK